MSDRFAWHAGRVLMQVVRRFGWHQTLCMTEADIDGLRADFVSVNKSGYLTEVEIKISRSDWRVEKERQRFSRNRPFTRQMFYAVPHFLADDPPDFVPPWVGIIGVYEGPNEDFSREIRPAVRQRAQKVHPDTLLRWRTNSYYRFWAAEVRRLGRQSRRIPRGPLAVAKKVEVLASLLAPCDSPIDRDGPHPSTSG